MANQPPGDGAAIAATLYRAGGGGINAASRWAAAAARSVGSDGCGAVLRGGIGSDLKVVRTEPPSIPSTFADDFCVCRQVCRHAYGHVCVDLCV